MDDIEAVDQRIVRGLPAVLRLTPTDQEGTTLDVAGPVEVTVVDHTGAEVLTDTAAEADGTWSIDVPASSVPELDVWSVEWVDDDTGATWATTVEVTGGHTVTVPEVLTSDPTVAGFTPEQVIAARLVAETEAEWICDRVFTPRLRTVVLDGNSLCELPVPLHDLRRIRSVTVDGTAIDVGTVSVDGGSLLATTPWRRGKANVTAVVEVGLTAPRPDLAQALRTRIRTILMAPDSHVPLDAVQWMPEAGGAYKVARASRFRCGIPEVDAVYFRYSKRASVGDDEAPAPASVPVDLNPSASSLFHGGSR